MKQSRLQLIALLIFILSACERNDIQPTGTLPAYKHPVPHTGNHWGNAIQSNDSAEAVQLGYQFPPLPDPLITYPHLNYNTGVATYDTVTSTYTITQSGNYTISASSYRDLIAGDSSDLCLSVNGITVYSTGFVQSVPIAFVTNQHLFQNDVIYIRTSTGHGVYQGGIFKLSK